MSALYRRYFIEGISESYANGSIKWDATEWKKLVSDLRNSSFNVYVKAPFAGPEQVVDYLGRYSHRVAITNHRIVDVSSAQVKITYKDYRDGARKVLKLSRPAVSSASLWRPMGRSTTLISGNVPDVIMVS